MKTWCDMTAPGALSSGLRRDAVSEARGRGAVNGAPTRPGRRSETNRQGARDAKKRGERRESEDPGFFLNSLSSLLGVPGALAVRPCSHAAAVPSTARRRATRPGRRSETNRQGARDAKKRGERREL